MVDLGQFLSWHAPVNFKNRPKLMCEQPQSFAFNRPHFAKKKRLVKLRARVVPKCSFFYYYFFLFLYTYVRRERERKIMLLLGVKREKKKKKQKGETQQQPRAMRSKLKIERVPVKFNFIPVIKY